MNSKRSRHKIYRLVDSIFLLLPFILMFGGFVCVWHQAGLYFIELDGMDFASSTWSDGYLEYYFEWYTEWFGSVLRAGSFGTFSYEFRLFIVSIFDFLGIGFTDDNGYFALTNFIMYYLIYMTFYEFLSLFINTVLWIPRYLRDWVQRHSSEGV